MSNNGPVVLGHPLPDAKTRYDNQKTQAVYNEGFKDGFRAGVKSYNDSEYIRGFRAGIEMGKGLK